MAISLTAGSAAAQSSKTPAPMRVIHLWVHGQYGSDSTTAGAPWMNPRCTGGGNGCNPTTECKPNLVTLTTGQVLLHAPWPFKTINQPGGALSYLPTPLPFSGAVEWEYAIIHVLPGLYARDDAYGSLGVHNPDNGLRPNGEKFPIHLPPRVSIQGTSALNTVFDVTSPELDTAGPAFEFGIAGATGKDSFIDSIAIFGADTEEKGPGRPPAKTFAAIALSNEIASAPTISNCFLYGNGTGVLVDAKADGSAGGPHDGTKLFNNTIAFNHVGLWNGDTTLSTGSSFGISMLILVNNIFDSSPEATPFAKYPTNWAYYPSAVVPPMVNNTGFEGVVLADLQVGLTSSIDSNAYETGRYNSGVAHPRVNLPANAPRTVGGFAPTHDILPYTQGTGGLRRGILFVRDALTKPVFATDTGNSTNFDQSPHDFRLSPAVASAISSNLPPNAPNVLNPLVNAGWGGPFPMKMANGLDVINFPGYLDLGPSQNTWAFHNWNWDCEGYGNARFQTHGSFYGNGGGSEIDIGADELGQLLAVGYRFATTSFMSVNKPPAGASIMDNKYQWFLGPPTGLVYQQTPIKTVPAPGNVNMPYFRAVDHLGSMPGNYTVGSYFPPWFSMWSFSHATTYYTPTFADTTPHLLDDFHPWWTGLVFAPTNPIWQACGGAMYNSYLYADPSAGRINPTGSYKGDIGQIPGNNFQWLDLSWTVSPRSPLTLTQPFNTLINFRNTATVLTLDRYDLWGRGYDITYPALLVDTFKVTYAYNTTPVALRYSMENRYRPAFTSSLTHTNLQSSMVLVEDDDTQGK